MTRLHELSQLGQSIWLDYIRRSFINSGELQERITAGVRGVTSNPSIFEKAIAGSYDYDDAIAYWTEQGKSVPEIYEALVLSDIQAVADLLRPVYEETDGHDGYVSLEVRPALAHDTEGTVAEARRLFAALDRPNVMIKVPATPEGIPAIRQLISEGISVNVTLIFSLAVYEAVVEAYLSGLEAYQGDLAQVASVASFFISRVDVAVDRELEALGVASLQGKVAIANAKVAYGRFRELFSSPRWQKLAERGARIQRPLWASTSTKNPHYPDTLYVDQLIGPDTVNTLPLTTLDAFLDHGTVADTLSTGLDEAQRTLAELARVGINLDDITDQLLAEGVAAFARSFTSLMESITQKQAHLQAGWRLLNASLGDYQSLVDNALAEMKADHIIRRIWQHDHTVWRPTPDEIANRLGWLHAPEIARTNIDRLQTFADSVRAEGFTDVLLLGMGGSSLAPELFARVFGEPDAPLKLWVLDSTDPGAVLYWRRRLNPRRTLFIVATKSGGTVETLSFFKYYYNWVAEHVGQARAGRHFVAITDPGSKLVKLAGDYAFRGVFLNDPNIGGRYSALSYFGLVPAALVGVDLLLLVSRAETAVRNAESCNCPVDGDNYGAQLGAIMGELAKNGRDKLTLIISPSLASFGDWVEQLVAESTGKDGKGILPVVGEPVGAMGVYGNDRLFVYLRQAGDTTYDRPVALLRDAGHPVVTIHLRDRYDLGGQFFLWEMATAVAGYRLGIQPFDQPNVESAKVLARQLVAAYQQSGTLPQDESAPLTAAALHNFLAQARPHDYIAIHAYVQPTPETDEALLQLRAFLRDRYHLATTVGYGPRFLHSTGQLHKGDSGNGLFIQLTSDAEEDAPIPDEAGNDASSMTFGVLKMAQALGDGQALRGAGRRVIRFHLGTAVADNIRQLLGD
ncbi:MAG: bifunctional transaldolase/phosoglucose isomerase [Chloroflexi bacterium]|nr:MAG: bifunctional transaldolase/phosoglucose isomerase [Chloroflexota bacterium]